jgi:hypothetical protein
MKKKSDNSSLKFFKFYLQSQEIQRFVMFSNSIVGIHSSNFS